MCALRRIAILGGGASALSAAFELSSEPDWQDKYEITVFQPGWRLGGKCASSRAEVGPENARASRIEEHGLHVWFGFYENAFNLIHRCYAELNGLPVASHLRDHSVRELFVRQPHTPLMERANGDFKHWPLSFPEDPEGVEPGHSEGVESGREALPIDLEFYVTSIRRFIAWVLAELERELTQSDRPGAEPLRHEIRSLQGKADASPIFNFDFNANDIARLLIDSDFGSISNPSESLKDSLEDALTSFGSFINDLFGWLDSTPLDNLGDKIRRLGILFDLGRAILRGILSDPLVLVQQDLLPLDRFDFRDFLDRSGARERSINSAPIRALYDLVFAYTDGDSTTFSGADLAAGAALTIGLKITAGYKGAVCYRMKAGMGDIVIAPIYEVLRARGVKFQFFTRVEQLVVDGAGEKIEEISLLRQASIAAGQEAYDPIRRDGDLLVWPEHPDFDQLVDGEAIKQSGIDFESSFNAGWSGQMADTLRRGAHFDDVVLGIPVEELRATVCRVVPIAQDLIQNSSWDDFLQTQASVETQSAQLWFVADLAGLGWRDPANPPSMIAAPERLDVWSDMSEVADVETWPSGHQPSSVQYLCGPMTGDFMNNQGGDPVQASRDQARSELQRWLETKARFLWPHTVADAEESFDWSTLIDLEGREGSDRLLFQHSRANIDPTERYGLSVAGSTEFRIDPADTGFANLFFASDTARTELNAGCVEAAVMAGRAAAAGIRALDDESEIAGPSRVPDLGEIVDLVESLWNRRSRGDGII